MTTSETSRMLLPVTEIQKFCMHDGPGVRTTVFFKGCPLRCLWCHNPETQETGQQILYYASKCMGCRSCETVCPVRAHTFTETEHRYDRAGCTGCLACANICPAGALKPALIPTELGDVFRAVERDIPFYGTEGGLTLSGGEPFFHPEEAIALLSLCRENGIGTAAETCGWFSSELIPRIARCTDLLLFDVKDTDSARHKACTGSGNERILENLHKADDAGIPTVLRCILVNGINTEDAHYEAVADLYRTLRHCLYVEWIPYHAYAGSKMLPLGKADNGNRGWIPEKETLCRAEDVLTSRGVPVKHR